MSSSNSLISFYRSMGQLKGVDIQMGEFLKQIKTSQDWKRQAEAVRAFEKGSPEYDEKKKQANCATLSGTYSGNKQADSLRAYSGFIAIDLDQIPNIDAAFNRICAFPFVYACFRSIGGKGLCVLVKIEPTRFLDAYYALEDFFLLELGLVVDASCKNVNRLRYVSYDPELFHNEESTLWKKYLPAKEKKRITADHGTFVHTDEDLEFVVRQFEERSIELHDSSRDWVRVGLALANQYKEAGLDYFQRISFARHDYNPEYTEARYKYFCKIADGRVKIATFYFIAKENGLQIMCPKTQQIARVAASYKRDKSNPDSAIRHLEQMDGVSREDSQSIVEQIFAAQIDIQLYDTIYQEAATYIQLKHNLKYNEITRHIEDNTGKSLEDRELNNIFFELMNMFNGKLKRSEFDTIIKSDIVPQYNPLKEFFNAYKDRNPVGCIDALADTITTDTGYISATEIDASYVRFFLRKFLIGLIASAFGQHSKLMIVLTGPQGTGKTEFWRRLLPKELQRFYAESKLDREKDDEILMCKKWLLMNDEFGGQTMKEAKKFKDLISKQTFTLREPYGRVSADLPRLALLCGTSNEMDVLNDPTGNRRIIPINVLGIDHKAYNAVDKIDLLIEAYHLFRNGERHELTKDEELRLKKSTGGFEAVTDERDLVTKYFANPTEETQQFARFFSSTDVKVFLERATNQRLGSKRIAQELKRLTGKESEIFRENRFTVRRGYMLVEINNVEIPKL